jgi:hypothetical protein
MQLMNGMFTRMKRGSHTMKLVRLLSENFDPVYVQPQTLARAARTLLPVQALTDREGRSAEPTHGRGEERRRGDRRQRRQPVMVDLRCGQARRKSLGRRGNDPQGAEASYQRGIDTYA